MFKFDHSSRLDDAAQSIVPFIDIRPILPNKSIVPLSGIDLCHITDSMETTSGFLTLSVKTHSTLAYIKNAMDDSLVNNLVEKELTRGFLKG